MAMMVGLTCYCFQKNLSSVPSVARLVQVLAALFRSARAGNLYILEGKLVVVRELLSLDDPPEGEDDDVLVAQYVNDLRVAVWLLGGRWVVVRLV